MKIIAFGYKKGTGKDTAARFLNTILRMDNGLMIKQISFAAKLKDVSHQLYGWAGLHPGVYYESHRAEKEIILPQIGLSPREIWIGVGNKLREVYQDTWIHFALHGVNADILIITDLRFRNEFEAIVKNGGITIKMLRSDISLGTDAAEVELDNVPDSQWKYVVNNNGTLKDLYSKMEKFAEILIT